MKGWAVPVTEVSVTGTFSFEHSSPVFESTFLDKNSFAFVTQRPEWHNFGFVYIFSFGICELALLVKLQE